MTLRDSAENENGVQGLPCRYRKSIKVCIPIYSGGFTKPKFSPGDENTTSPVADTTPPLPVGEGAGG